MPTDCENICETPRQKRGREIVEKVMEILRAEKLTRNEAHGILEHAKYAVDSEATLGYCPVSEV